MHIIKHLALDSNKIRCCGNTECDGLVFPRGGIRMWPCCIWRVNPPVEPGAEYMYGRFNSEAQRWG